MIRTPYLIADVPTGATTTSTVLTAAANTSPGDVLVVGYGGPGSSPVAVSGVTDSAGNPYTQACAVAPSGTLLPASFWIAPCITPIVSGTSQLTVAYNSAASRAKTIHWAGVSGASAVDQAVANDGSGTTASVSTGGLNYEPEVAFFLIVDAFAGASPTGLGSFISLGTIETGATQWQTLAYQIVNSTTAVSGSATITSAGWSALMVTITGSSPAGLLMSNGPALRRAATW